MLQLTTAQYAELTERMDALREEHTADLGEKDVAWIRAYIAEWESDLAEGFAQIEAAWTPWGLYRGVVRFTVGRIKEFFEGHNILHGQYDRLEAELPELHSSRYRWESAIHEEAWKAEHNLMHHTRTNIIGKDPDLSHGWLRTHDAIPWHPWHLVQLPYYAAYYLIFTYIINGQNFGLIDLMRLRMFGRDTGYAAIDKLPREGSRWELAAWDRQLALAFIRRKFFEPAKRSSAFTPKLLLCLLVSELVLNVWVAVTIQASHQAEPKYPEGYRARGKGEWYLRQIESSRNFALGDERLLKLYGALNYQIEHHLFPALPAWRYLIIAPRVQEICSDLGVPYKADAHRWQTFLGFVRVVARHSLPPMLGVRRARREPGGRRAPGHLDDSLG
jgi:linoleoyl-CoA desaturase